MNMFEALLIGLGGAQIISQIAPAKKRQPARAPAPKQWQPYREPLLMRLLYCKALNFIFPDF